MASTPLSDPATLAAVMRSAIADLADLAFVVDLDRTILTANAVLTSRSGLSIDEVIGQPLLTIIHDEDRSITEEHLERALSGEATTYRIVRVVDGVQRYVSEVALHPMRDGDEVVAVYGIARDVTEVVDVARERRSAEELLQIAGRMAGFGGWSMDAADRVLRLSDEARTILAIPPGREFVLSEMLEAQPDRTRSAVRAAVRECLDQGHGFDLRLEIVTSTGTTVIARILGRPERDQSGAVVRALGAIWDITEVEAERARLVELEEQLTLTLDTISDGIIFLDQDWRFTYVNAHAVDILGMSADDLLARSAWDVFPGGVDGPYWVAYHRALETGTRQQVREYFEPLGGWFDVIAYPTSTGLALYVRDVTEEENIRQRAEVDARRMADQARLLDASHDAMIVRSLDHAIEYWNRASSELYGWTADEAVGRSARDLLYADPAVFDTAHATVLRDGYWNGDIEQHTRDGRALTVECRWQLVYDAHGKPSAVFAVNADVTETRRATDAQLRAQRMESLGTLAGGIAHDLNNVLTPILMSIQLLEQQERPSQERQILASMEEAVKRGADMIRQVLSFARGVEGRRVRVPVARLVDDLAAFARDTLPKGIRISSSTNGLDVDTMGDPTQLLQVLINLVTNASDAMPTGGHLQIGTRLLSIDDEYSTVSHTAPAGEYVTIEVEDDGHGMSPDVIAKVFEPFYTTKGHGRGTGLGLATSLAIVRSHGGFMQVYSEPGNGTKFLVSLPLATADEPATMVGGTHHRDRPNGDGEVILVVDDEPMIRQVTAQTLEAHGYRVVTATDGRSALTELERATTPVDLVLTDMMMPIMDGATLSAHLEEEHPGLPIIAMSGLSSYGSSGRTIGMGISRFLPKPFTTGMLLTTVSDTLKGVPTDDEEAP